MATKGELYLDDQQQNCPPELAEKWSEIRGYFSKRLWHQLTLVLLEFIKHDSFSKGAARYEMYKSFIAEFEHKINALSLVEFCELIVPQIANPEEALGFLEKTREKVKGSDEAVVLCITTTAKVKLDQALQMQHAKTDELEIRKKVKEVKTLLEEANSLIEKLPGVTAVHGRYYELSSNYHQLLGNYAEYYRDALRYLGCTKLELVPGPYLSLVEEQKNRAFNLGLSALLGEDVYNFGELLQHPILETLRGTPNEWLIDLLFAFNSGNLNKFVALESKWKGQEDLRIKEFALRQKISLLCLMEMTFKRPANNRSLQFSEISQAARIPEDEVELLVMKALSIGLVKGQIDQVEKTVHLTWVQPRVLDREQLATMNSRIQEWCGDVKNMQLLVENSASDILT